MSETEFARAERYWIENCKLTAELAALKAENKNLLEHKVYYDRKFESGVLIPNEEYSDIVKKSIELKAENEKLRKALEWYANPVVYFHNSELVEDGFRRECGVFHYTDPPKEIPGIPLGTRAKEALKETE